MILWIDGSNKIVFSRIWSLKNSCDTFPTSLVMIYNKSEVVGHSKLSAIPSIPDACFVESGKMIFNLFYMV